MRYSASTKGFYPDSINYPNLPNDVVQITDDDYAGLMAAQSLGKFIVAVDGFPIAQDPPILPYAPSNLTPARFEYLLANTGLDDVWAALEAELKDTDRALFAQIKAQRSSLSFSQAKTLDLVARFKDTAERVAPDADLSEDAIKAAWVVAEQAEL
tara:strand:- start:239 stop:703 length:465 start_codon:yes stop_codon:yes gene_type:complete